MENTGRISQGMLPLAAFSAGAAALAACFPVQLSVVAVFVFAGPHNWMEARYFAARMPVRAFIRLRALGRPRDATNNGVRRFTCVHAQSSRQASIAQRLDDHRLTGSLRFPGVLGYSTPGAIASFMRAAPMK